MGLYFKYNGIINFKDLNDVNEFNFKSLLSVSKAWQEISGNKKWSESIDIEFLFHEKYPKDSYKNKWGRDSFTYRHMNNTSEVKAIVISAKMENFHMDFVKFNEKVQEFLEFLYDRYDKKIINAIFTVSTELETDTVFFNPLEKEFE